MLVSVCICTYARPAISETINSILAQRGISLSDVEIVVCDEDDAKTSAERLIRSIASKTSVPIKYIVCTARNLAVCRNACISAATGEWIAFIDDDETADPNWLAELLIAQARHGADVVKSYVGGAYPPETPNWVKKCDPFTRDLGPTGTPLRFVATNGVLFRRALAVEHGIAFDPKFGSGGGEDPDFFLRFFNKGARMISCRSSIVNEHAPISRLNMGYFRRRFKTDGYVYGLFYISQLPRAHRAVMIAKSWLIIGLCLPYPIVMLANVSFGFKMFRKLWAHLGIVH